jgi:hypothetical protein
VTCARYRRKRNREIDQCTRRHHLRNTKQRGLTTLMTLIALTNRAAELCQAPVSQPSRQENGRNEEAERQRIDALELKRARFEMILCERCGVRDTQTKTNGQEDQQQETQHGAITGLTSEMCRADMSIHMSILVHSGRVGTRGAHVKRQRVRQRMRVANFRRTYGNGYNIRQWL